VQYLLLHDKVDKLFDATSGLRGLETILTFDALMYAIPRFIASKFIKKQNIKLKNI